MNLKVRIKNPVFWLTFGPICINIVYQILAMVGVTPRLIEDNVVQTFNTIISLLAGLGILVDPTTKGIGDSQSAMTYELPKGDE